jgi:hypothetical protein
MEDMICMSYTPVTVDQSIALGDQPPSGSAMRALSEIRRNSRCLRIFAAALCSLSAGGESGRDRADKCVLSRICCTVNRAFDTAWANTGISEPDSGRSYQAAHSALSRSPVPVNGISTVGRPYAQVCIPSDVQELAKHTSP